MKHKSFLNYHEKYIPAKYDEEGTMIEPPHLLQWYRCRNYYKKRVSTSYKYIDEVLEE